MSVVNVCVTEELQDQRLWLGGGEDSSWDFIWLDNSVLVNAEFAPWGPRQPDGMGNCLAVYGGSDFGLANWPCELVSYYICHSFQSNTS